MKLAYPLNYPPRVNQYFGENPDIYKQYKIDGVALKGHEGIDLDCENGTEIYAADDGFAQEVTDQGKVGYGKYIKLIHSWGETLYGHQRGFNIKQGDQVRRGQVIGFADSTGNSTGNHLHFGVRVNPYNRKDGWGGYSDPAPLLFTNEPTEVTLPKWLMDFLNEKQIPLDKVEPTIRSWYDASTKLGGLEGENQSYKDFFDDLRGITGATTGNFADVTGLVTGLITYRNNTSKIEDEYTDFRDKVAGSIKSSQTDSKKILDDLTKYVSAASPSDLPWQTLIILGLQKMFSKEGEVKK